MISKLALLLLIAAPEISADSPIPLRPPLDNSPPKEEFHCIIHAENVLQKWAAAIVDSAGTDMRLYSGGAARAILKTINESPPETHYKADALFVIIHSAGDDEEHGGQAGKVLIFQIQDECITGNLPVIPMGAWAHIMHETGVDDL